MIILKLALFLMIIMEIFETITLEQFIYYDLNSFSYFFYHIADGCE